MNMDIGIKAIMASLSVVFCILSYEVRVTVSRYATTHIVTVLKKWSLLATAFMMSQMNSIVFVSGPR